MDGSSRRGPNGQAWSLTSDKQPYADEDSSSDAVGDVSSSDSEDLSGNDGAADAAEPRGSGVGTGRAAKRRRRSPPTDPPQPPEAAPSPTPLVQNAAGGGLAALRALQLAADVRESASGDGVWEAMGSLARAGGRSAQVLSSRRVRGLTVVRGYLSDEEHHAVLDAADGVLVTAAGVSQRLPRASEEDEPPPPPPNQAVFLGAGGFPPWATALGERVARDLASLEHTGPAWRTERPVFSHLLVNEYYPGEGIGAHVDLPNRFADGVAGVSLASAAVFRLAPAGDCGSSGGAAEARPSAGDVEELLLPGDLYAIERDARWRWTHRIDAVDGELWDGHWIERGRR